MSNHHYSLPCISHQNQFKYHYYGDYWYGGTYFLCCTRSVRDTAAYSDALAGVLPDEPYTPPTPDLPWLELSERDTGKLHIRFTVSPPHGQIQCLPILSIFLVS